jgi:hypothetical protein
MAYSGFVEFAQDLRAAHGVGMTGDDYLNSQRAYTYYLHGLAQGERSGLTIGLIAHLQDDLRQGGSVFGAIGTTGAHDPNGRIFVAPVDSLWTVYFNDAFIIGGIHSHGDFTLVAANILEPSVLPEVAAQMPAGARQLDVVFNPDGNYPLRVTQRECIALGLFGYSATEQANGSVIYHCATVAAADGATLTQYVQQVNALTAALRT